MRGGTDGEDGEEVGLGSEEKICSWLAADMEFHGLIVGQVG